MRLTGQAGLNTKATNPAKVLAGLNTNQKEEPAVKRRAKYILPALSLGLCYLL